MAFWSTATAAPTMRRNFKVSTTDSEGVWWWAIGVTKPSFEIATTEYQLVNQRHKYPGLLTWQDVTVRIVDIGERTKKLYEQVYKNGYINADKYSGVDGIMKAWDGTPDATDFLIEQYSNTNTGDTPVEKWILHNCFIKSIRFGDMEYSSDELVELELVLSYDYAELDGAAQSPQGGGFQDNASRARSAVVQSTPTPKPKPTAEGSVSATTGKAVGDLADGDLQYGTLKIKEREDLAALYCESRTRGYQTNSAWDEEKQSYGCMSG